MAVKGAIFRRFSSVKQDAQISETFADLSQSGTDTGGMTIKGGKDLQYAIQSFIIPKPPPFGDAQLQHLELFTTTIALTPGRTSTGPEVIAYKIKSPEYLGQTTSSDHDVFYGEGSITEVTRDLIVGNVQVEDEFPRVTCDFFDGQTGFTEKGLVLTTNRQSKIMLGNISLSLEDAYEYGYSAKGGVPYSHRYGSGVSSAIKWSSHKKGTLTRMRQKHGKGQHMGATEMVEGEEVYKKTSLVPLKADATAGWYCTTINREGTYNATVYFRESAVKTHGTSGADFMDDNKTYGDEVSSENSFFTQVRGSTEFFETEPPTDEGSEMKHTMEAVGAVRFTTENVTTQGKCAQFYSYINKSPSVANYRELQSNGLIGICDAVAYLGPLPMPCGPIPMPEGMADSPLGHDNSNFYGYNYGGYNTGKIEITFTIPKLSNAARFTASSNNWCDLYRRSFIMGFSSRPPDLSSSRAYDYFYDDDPSAWAGIAFLKNPNGGAGSTKEGIYVVDLKGSSNAAYTNSNASVSNFDAMVNGEHLGPLSEGATYTITFAFPTAHSGNWDSYNTTTAGDWDGSSSDSVKVTIHEGKTLITSVDASYGYMNMSRDDAASDQDTFSVVTIDVPGNAGGGLAGNSFSVKETYKYLSFWANNTKNQRDAGDWQGYTEAAITAVDISIDADESPEVKVNIDNIKIGNYNLPKTNCTILTPGNATISGEEAQSDIFIKSGMSRTMNANMATSSRWHSSSDLDGLKAAIDKQTGDALVRKNDLGWGQVPGYSIICLGTQTSSDFASASDRYLFFNNFTCANLRANSILPDDASGAETYRTIAFGCYSGNMGESASNTLVPLGFQGCSNSVVNKKAWAAVATETVSGQYYNGTDRDHHISIMNNDGESGSWAHAIAIDGMPYNLASHLGSVESFTRKGLAKLEIGATLDPVFARRENFFMSAKVLAYDQATGTMTVDTTEPFKNNDDVTYIAYVMGGYAASTNMYKKEISLLEIVDKNTVKVDWDGYAQDNSTRISKTDILPGLWISPFAYWITLFIPNWKSFNYGSIDATPDNTADYDVFSATNLPQKSYDSLMVVSDTGTTPGATFNEWKYSDGVIAGAYDNVWDLEPASEDSIFELQDYGYGGFKTDDEIPQGYKGGYVGRGTPTTSGTWSMLFPKVVKQDSLKPGDSFTILLRPKNIDTDHQIQFYSKEATKTSQRPLLVGNFLDPLPLPLGKVRIEPEKDKPDVPVLRWDAPQDTDLWYGLVITDDKPIKHQYHNAIVHLPFNDAGKSNKVLLNTTTDVAARWYNYQGDDIRQGKILNGQGQSHGGPQYDAYINMSFNADGLAGNRIMDHGSIDDSDIGQFSVYQSGGGFKLVPSNDIVWRYDSSSGAAKWRENTDVDNFSWDEMWNAVNNNNAWSIADSDRPSDVLSVSMIISPKAYPPAEYVLQMTSGGNATILNSGGSPYTVAASLLNLSGNTDNDQKEGYLGRDTPQTNLVYDHVLAKITSNSSNGGLTNAEYVQVKGGSDGDADDDDLNIGSTDTAAGGVKLRGLYGTGSTAGGGGTAGVPTNGGTVTIIPRHYLWSLAKQPRITNADTTYQIVQQGNEVVTAFLDSEGKVNVWLQASNQNLWMKIKSQSSIIKDGITPTHVAFVFDSTLEERNLKLYINGTLEDFTGRRLPTGTDRNLQNDADGQAGEALDFLNNGTYGADFTVQVGGVMQLFQGASAPNTYFSSSFVGAIEEFVVYKHPIEIVNPATGKHVIERKYPDLYDVDNSPPKTHYAKLFIKDYHNIRGTSDEEVQSTNNIEWQKPSFALNMS